MTISVYSEFQPLREIVVGSGYPPEYFDHIGDAGIRTCLQQIFGEIEEDFSHLQRTLESLGVTVLRPQIISREEFDLNPMLIPPLTPRDRQGVFGQKLVRMGPWGIWDWLFDHYSDLAPDQVLDPFRSGPDADHINGANNSCVYRMGRDIWFDHSEWMTPQHSAWLRQHVLQDPAYRFHDMHTLGHGDCVFAVLRPGVLLTSYHDGVEYQRDFPDWHMHCVDTPSINRHHYQEFRDRSHPGGTWWVPGADNVPGFRAYVDQYLQHWVGAMHESVFDVNCVSVDESHVIFGCYDKAVFDYCRGHGIEPILCDIRHRFFFDGSVHCCTLDTRREGGMEDYFG
jgi:hypothetical protein